MKTTTDTEATTKTMHTCDADCAPYIDADEQCSVCGVTHTYQCEFCGGRGFHADPECPAMWDTGSAEYDAARARWTARA